MQGNQKQVIEPRQEVNSSTPSTRSQAEPTRSQAQPGNDLREALPPGTKRDIKEAAKAVAQISQAAGSMVSQTGKAVVEAATSVGDATATQTQRLIEQATQKAGQAISFVSDNWLLRKVSWVFKLDWLFNAADRVDLEKASAAVRKLQQEHPNEKPSQIAHRLMVEKAVYGGGIGLVSSIVPGEALALLAVDLAATSLLQAEMIYQIAAAYGLDLKDSARKGEVLGIFGLAFGGSRAVRAGLGFLRNIPLAGAAIGASSNAVMIYSLGYAACRFYEAKLNTSSSEAALAAAKEGTEKYLETAIAQEAIMDQILVHILLATHPQKSWEEILPALQKLNLSSASMEAIAANIKSPQPLDTLLNQLNRDYAVSLLAQCQRIAQHGVQTLEAEKVMASIAAKVAGSAR